MRIRGVCGRDESVSSRRVFLAKSAFGFGTVALDSLLERDGAFAPDAANPLAPKAPHFPAKAKSVIFLFMVGGPSHLDTFDPKPELKRLDGQSLPRSFKSDDLNLQFMKATEGKLMGSAFPFRRRGKSGLEISDLFTRVGEHADDLAVIRSCYHESFIHGPALTLLQTGSVRLGHPSAGAWTVYGLGCESENLPAFVVLSDAGIRSGGSTLFGSGFLPAVYQGTLVRTEGAPIQNLRPPEGMSLSEQRHMLDQLAAWNRGHLEGREDDSRLAARIANYELAFRMQSAAPELMDLSKETEATREEYGTEKAPTSKFGRMCLLARRMVERGVRFVLLYSNDWDGHGDCPGNHKANADRIDRPIGALLGDLKRRNLLESTLVVWTGEFGRTPVMQGDRGRDHSPYGFTTWMAGGGIRGGKVIGATDELGFRAVEDKVHVNDLHATMLSLLGLDHQRLTYLFEGRLHRLTDVGGHKDLAKRLTN